MTSFDWLVYSFDISVPILGELDRKVGEDTFGGDYLYISLIIVYDYIKNNSRIYMQLYFIVSTIKYP